MRYKLLFPVLLIVLLFVTVAIAQTTGNYGYSGSSARERRLLDPSSRNLYFTDYTGGFGYNRPYVNMGSKGPNYRATNTGAKSAFSGFLNFDTNALTSRGRDPSKISNFDPNIRGYSRTDVSAELLPFHTTSFNNKNVIGKGVARLLSFGNPYGTSSSDGASIHDKQASTQVWIQVVNLAPLGDDYIYEAWLVDEDSGYSLSMGVIEYGSGLKLSGQMIFEIGRNTAMFEGIMITKEKFPDTNPSPDGEVILWGDFGVSRTSESIPSLKNYERLR